MSVPAMLRFLDPRLSEFSGCYGAKTLSLATLATTPPTQANMVPISASRYGAVTPAYMLNVEIIGDGAAATLADAWWWGWSRLNNRATRIKLVNDGYDVPLSSTLSYGASLRDVEGLYTHIGITGTLSLGNIVLTSNPVELRS